MPRLPDYRIAGSRVCGKRGLAPTSRVVKFVTVNQTAAATRGFPSVVFERCRSFVAGAQGAVNFEGMQSVLFLARRGECTLRCYVTRHALIAYFGAKNGDADVGQDCLRAYDKSAVFIQEVVRRLIEGEVQPGSGVFVITTDVVFRHLTHLTTGSVAGAFLDVADVAAAARSGRADTPQAPC